MRRTRIFVVALLALLALLALAPGAYAQGPGGVVVGGERTIESGQTFDGDMAVFGGNLTVKAGGTINGNLTVFGGNADIAGTVRGNVVSIGGNTRLREGAVVEGDTSTIGGNINRDPNATVRGRQTQPGQAPPVPGAPTRPNVQVPPEPRNPVLGFLGWLFRTTLVTLGLALLAVLAVALLPNQTQTVAETMRRNPGASFGIGGLTWVVAAVVGLLLSLIFGLLILVCIGLLGIPVLIVLGIAFAVAGLFGWLSTGLLVGEGLLRGMRVSSSAPLIAAGLGTFIITLVYHVLGSVQCLGGLLAWLLTLPGLGAVVLTWFGTRRWRPGDPYLPSRGPRGPVGPAPTPAPGWAPALGPGSWPPAPSSAPTPPASTPMSAGDAMLAQGAAVAQAARDQAQAQPSPWAPPAPPPAPPAAPPSQPPMSSGDLLTRMGEDIPHAPVRPAPPVEAPIVPPAPPVPPAAPVAVTPSRRRDNLQVLPLVGPKYEGLFNARDVYSYADLAALTPAQVVTILTDPNVFPVTEDQARAMIDEARRLAGE